MRKKIFILIALLAAVIGTIGYYAYNSTHGALTDFTVSYHSLESSQIPKSFDDTSVMFISDLEYGTFFNQARLEKLQSKMETLDNDIVIFGGDLFDRNYIINSDDIEKITVFLKNIKAPLGKFAILGDFDISNMERQQTIEQILFNADFELLKQDTLHIYNNSGSFITLTGISYSSEEISDRFISLTDGAFNIAVIHGAKMFDNFPNDMLDLTLCGHSHHVQIDYPFFGAYQQYNMTGKYKAGSYTSGQSLLYVSRGIGTTNVDRRLFSSPEIVVFRLKHYSPEN